MYRVVSRKKVHLGVTLLEEITLSFVDRSTQTFFIQRGSGYRFSSAFPIFDMLIPSGDIRDQSQKLSKIAQNFGRFFCRHKYFGAGIVKIVPILSPLPCGTSTEKSPVRTEDIPTSPEVIASNTLNFRPDF